MHPPEGGLRAIPAPFWSGSSSRRQARFSSRNMRRPTVAGRPAGGHAVLPRKPNTEQVCARRRIRASASRPCHRQLEQLRALLAAIVPGNRFYSTAARGGWGDRRESREPRGFFRARALHATSRISSPIRPRIRPTARITPSRSSATRASARRAARPARPLVILDTPESWDWMLGNWAHIYRGAGRRAGRPHLLRVFVRTVPRVLDGVRGGGETRLSLHPRRRARQRGARLRAMIQHRATVLCCTPTYALHLAEAAREEGIDLRESAVRKIIVAGEPGGSVPAGARSASARRGMARR